ncbi:hypothetical protein BASA81_011264 [Batrachochytrium salamandrivorans]|nr:hypothetical protein BASA81_011264 [Batrachochytrium salamandrivorans]
MLRLSSRALFSTKKVVEATLSTQAKLSSAPLPATATTASSSNSLASLRQSALTHNLSVSHSKTSAPIATLLSKEELAKFNLNATYAFLFHKEKRATKSRVQASSANATAEFEEEGETIEAMNRNARRPKKANKGARPCSHVARRARRIRRHSGW